MHLFSFLLIIPDILPIDGMCSLSSQSNLAAQSRAFRADQVVQTSPVTGQWMSLQDATTATGLSEKTLRRYIKKGEVKSKRLGKLVNSPLQLWIVPEAFKDMGEEDDAITEIFEAETEIEDAQAIEQSDNFSQQENFAPAGTGGQEVALEVALKIITEQFSQHLGEHKSVMLELQRELKEKDIQLRLLPDLQKQLRDREALEKSVEFEKTALEKQIEALKQENDQLKQQVDSVKTPEKKSWWSLLFSPGTTNA